jgi:hypothetical protein
VNTQPYARKIEKGLSPAAPDGVYEVVAALAKRRFGNIASIKFSYRAPLAGGVLPYVAIDRKMLAGHPDRARARAERALRAPAIVIVPR